MEIHQGKLFVSGTYDLEWFRGKHTSDPGVLAVYDMPDAAGGPSVRGLVETEILSHIAVSDTVLYGSTDKTTLWVFDVSDPDAPRGAIGLELAREERRIGDVDVLSDRLFVGGGRLFGSSFLLDVTEPLQPSVIPMRYPPPGLLKTHQERLFSTGFYEYEVVGRHRPLQTAELAIGYSTAIESMRDHMVVASDALRFVNVSVPGEPYIATSSGAAAYAEDFATTGEFLYVSVGRDGMLVIAGWD
jgi:hypothetical protein